MELSRKDYEEIGNRIRDVQRKYSLVDRDVAEMLSLTIDSYRSMVRGRRPMGEEYLILFARQYHPDMNYIFYGIAENGIILPEYKNTLPVNGEESLEELIAKMKILPASERLKGILSLQDAVRELLETMQMDMDK